MSPLSRRRTPSPQRIISPHSVIIVIALLLSVIAINWESAALRVGYAQGGLVAAFNFDEGTGSIAADGSGLGNHGVITGATWSTTARAGRSLSITNDDQYVTVADMPSLDLTGGFTLEAWVRPSSVSNGRPVIVKELAGGPAYWLTANDSSAAKPAAWARVSGALWSAVGGSRLFTGIWTHLAATYNGTTLRLYVNGVSVASRALSGSVHTSDLPLRIGGSLVRDEYFRGLIDDVRVYNRSLSALEIQSDMATPVTSGDTVPPQVAFTAPADGADLSSTVTLAATATDNRTVAGVQFYLDGTPLGAEDTTAPYTITWDTGSATNGAHLLTATAHDPTGNTASADIIVVVDNAPQLVILQPPSGATINGSTIDISYTTAHQLTPEVHHVHFVLDGGSTRMDLSFDGSYQIGGVAGGTHILNGYLARSDHSKINGSDAAPVSFTTVLPDTAPPSVAIALPVADATVTGPVIIRAHATDDTGVASVQFLVDGLELGDNDTEAPYEMAWDSTAIVNGLHTISARARDAAGNEAASAAVSVTVANAPPPDTEAPSVAITSPTANDIIAGSATVRADAADNVGVAGVQFLLDGLALGSEDTEAPYEIAWDSTTVANGPHVVSAMARDAAGNPGIAGAVTVTIDNFVEPPPDTTSPAVAIVLPAADATLSGAVIVRAEATDEAGVAGVQFLVDDVALGTEDTEAPYEMAWDTATIGNGPHTISARARDAAGNTGVAATINVSVANADVTAPSVTIAAPSPGSTVTGIVSLGAEASDNVGVAGVQFLVDGSAVGSEDTEAPYEISWDSNSAANGPHTILARARDEAGNTSDSATVSVEVDNADVSAPSVTITAPAAGATVLNTVTVRASASDNIGVAGVQFMIDGVAFGGEDTAAPFEVAWDSSSVANGSHTISARARDAAGNTSVAAAVSVTVENADTTAPSVAITQPTANATVAGTVTWRASATDNIGVAGVQFLVDGVAVGAEDSVAPYEGSWDSRTSANGSHTVSARARDAAGNTTIATVVSVTVANTDTVPPTVSITDPDNNDTLTGSVSLRAEASDNVGVAGVQFLIDGLPVGIEDTSASYRITWDSSTTTNGAHTVSARARDAAGNTRVSTAVNVTVSNADLTAPSVSITSPVANATLVDIVAISANATDNVGVAGVQFLVDGIAVGSEDTSAPFSINWDSDTAANGPHTISARARDAAGNTTLSASVNVSVANVDVSAPSVTITAPAANATLVDVVTLSVNASDNIGVAGVTFLVDGVAVGAEDTSAPYSVSWDSKAIANGAHTISARARDAAGNITVSAAVSVTVNNPDLTAPSVSITQPAANATLVDVVTISANATDNIGVAGVTFLVDGVAVGGEDTSAPYSVSWDSKTVANGAHTISARARDAAGNITVSAAVSVTVNNPDVTAPSVSITQPAANATVVDVVTLSANASDNIGVAGVTFLVDGVAVGGEDTSAPYSVSWDSKTIANGAHTISARARDAAGNTTVSASVNVTVANADVSAPSVTITAPAANATVIGTITLSASASDNIGVAGVQFLVDGVAVGAEDNAAPFSVNWDSRTLPNGAHTVTARARDAAGNVTTSAAVGVTVANPDVAAPSAAITLPAANATLAGTVTLRASAVDNIGVAGVQFLVDGIATGAEDTTAPYEITFDSRTAANGPHTISARARDAAGNIGIAPVINVTIANADIGNPSVAITLPAANATLINTVTLRAAASDNVGVAGVQFLVDGLAAGSEDTVAPYEISWDSKLTANGSHSVSARARDAAGNTAVSAAVSVTVANAATGPAAFGQWSAPISIPVVAIHQALLPTGKVLMWDAADFTTAPPILWDPQTSSFENIGATATDLFCAGNAMLANGKLLVVGGDTRTTGLGVNDVNLFDPQTESWSTGPRMASRRWYPTASTLSDGRVFVLSGYDACYGPSCLVGRAEIYNPLSNTWGTLPSTANYVSPSYPFLFEMPDGRIIHAGSYEGTTDTRALDLATNTWSVIDSNTIDAGSAVMYAPGKIMKSGKWANSDPPFVAAHGNTYVMDLDQPSPRWRSTAPMNHARAYNMLTLLPDGTTLATAGSRNTDPGSAANGVLEAEIWSPVTETWTSMARMQNARMYHGSSMLLPDGRVLVAGSGRYGSPEQFNAEIYSPPYLFKGARPVITSAPEIVAPGQSFDVGTSDTNITAVTMLRIGAMTHSFNTDQRFMSLAFTAEAGGLQAQVPGNVHVMIPGYYMLFLVNSAGVPSVGRFVRVPATTEDAVAPAAPANLLATGALGQASLTWTASTDNVAVTGYSVHRSTVSGFVPSAATLRATTASTAFVDLAVTAGTYYYRVIARDAAGNESIASNIASAIVTADVQAPTVAVTAPLNGASVSGSINVTAAAADNVGVAGVRFLLDGVALGVEDVSAPYSVAWDTTTAPAGSHQLAAVARDGAGNTTISTAVSVTVPGAPAPTGLVLALGFDEGAGTTAADSSGLSNNATLSSTTWTPSGRFGAALTFNGTSSWATVADNNTLDLTNGMTLSAWVRPTSITADFRTILLKESAPGLAYSLYSNDGASRPPSGYVNTGGADIAAVASANLALNTWTHLAVTYNGSALQIYVNGTLVRTTNNTGAIQGSTGPLRIGGNSVWGEFFAGTIDEVRVYNRALTAAELQGLMGKAVNAPPVQ